MKMNSSYSLALLVAKSTLLVTTNSAPAADTDDRIEAAAGCNSSRDASAGSSSNAAGPRNGAAAFHS